MKLSPARTFTLVGVLGEVPLWSFFLVSIVWWIEDLAFSPARIVVLGMMIEVTVLFTEVPTGIVADRYSRRWSVQISFLLIGAAMLMHAASSNYAVLLVSLMLVGLGWTFRSGADIAWLADQFGGPDAQDSDEVERIIVRRQMVILLVNVVTVPVTVLLGLWSTQGAIAIIGLVTVIGGLVVTPLLDGKGNAESDLGFVDLAREGRRIATNQPVIRRVLLMTFLLSIATPAVDWLGLDRFLEQGDFDDQSLPFMGGLFVVIAIAAAITVWGVEKRMASGVSYPMLAGGLLFFLALGTGLSVATPVALVALGLLVHDMAMEAFRPVSSSWVNPFTDDSSRATVHSMVGQVYSLGELAGGALAAVVATISGVRTALAVAAVLSFGAALVAWATPNATEDQLAVRSD